MRTAGTFEAETLPPHHYQTQPAAPIAWKSTVPIYLFGGLAAMLGLIAFSLLILACSYWKLSGAVAGDGKATGDELEKKGGEVVVNSVLVIMAGEDTPTFIATATPAVTGGASSVGGGSDAGSSSGGGGDGSGERREKMAVELSSSMTTTNNNYNS